MRIFLVRHGETEPNRLGLALGRLDVPLNERGRWQAARLGEALSGEALAAVYSSPLQRALATATAIAEAHGLEVRVEERLIEMDIGEVDGLPFAEVQSRYPEFLKMWAGDEGPTTPMPGGERLVDVADRAWAALRELADRHQEETVAAVTHNFVILSLLTRAIGVELANFRRLRHAVGAISVLNFAHGQVIAERLNDTCHLDSG